MNNSDYLKLGYARQILGRMKNFAGRGHYHFIREDRMAMTRDAKTAGNPD